MLPRISVAACFLVVFVRAQEAGDSCREGAELREAEAELSLMQVFRSAPLESSRREKKAARASSDTEYPWSQRGRDYTKSSSTSDTAPTDLSSREASWIWPNEDDEQVRHSPLIDHNNDIYVTTGWKIRKFSSDGTILWTVDTDHMVASPALYKGTLYAVSHRPCEGIPCGLLPGQLVPSQGISLLMIDMADGTSRSKSIEREQDGDASSIFVYNDTVVFAVKPEPNSTAPSIHNVYAVDASDGNFLWEFAPDDALWNFSPSSPGDGTLVFAGSCGRVYRVTFEGQLVWKRGPEVVNGVQMCGTGGGAMGPNGIFYNEYNEGPFSLPTPADLLNPGSQMTMAHVSAHRVSDGKHLWTKDFPSEYHGHGMGNQYPAVGKIGNSETLAVVAAIGPNPNGEDQYLPDDAPEELWMPNSVVALDAETGEVIWRYDEPKWPHLMAAGDEKSPQRALRAVQNAKTDIMCLPDTQGIPLIAGDGTVYMTSSHWGDLRAIKDEDGDGVINNVTEVSSFSTHNCFLNSPSLAPGMLVAAPCWGPMYVFKSE